MGERDKEEIIEEVVVVEEQVPLTHSLLEWEVQAR